MWQNQTLQPSSSFHSNSLPQDFITPEKATRSFDWKTANSNANELPALQLFQNEQEAPKLELKKAQSANENSRVSVVIPMFPLRPRASMSFAPSSFFIEKISKLLEIDGFI